MSRIIAEQHLQASTHLQTQVLEPMKREFIGKDEIIDLLGVCLVGGENLFILGPPGTAKSALVHNLSKRLHGETFIYLLTRFTEPNELFGPFDIRRLREGELTTNTSGMLTEASLVFLDELLNANSAILNSLLTALNERVLHRGHERIDVQALFFIGASNHLPQEDALQALFDRFLLRVTCDNVAPEQLTQVLEAGWRFETPRIDAPVVTFAELRELQKLLPDVSLELVRHEYAELIRRIRHAGIGVSDRRAVKLQRVIASSALLCGRAEAQISDLWVLRYIWDTVEQQETLRALVQDVVGADRVNAVTGLRHVQADSHGLPNPEALARDVAWIEEQLRAGTTPALQALLRDRLAVLDGRAQWVQNSEQREYLASKIQEIWPLLDQGQAQVVPA